MRLTTGLFLVVLIAGLSGAANAGECDKVRSAYSRAVCNNENLRTINSAMEAALERLQTSLSRQGQKLLRSGQRSWREYAATVCTSGESGPVQEYGKEGLECLRSVLESRRVWLEKDWRVGSHQTFPFDTFLARPNLTSEIGAEMGVFDFTATLLGGSDEISRAFNAFALNGYSDGLLKPQADLEQFDGGAEIETGITIYEITERRISSVVDIYAYYYGAAHGNSSVSYEHFLTRELRALAPEDIFSQPGWQNRLAMLVRQKLTDNPDLAEVLWEDLTEVDRVATDPTRWRFDDRGIEFQFQPYEIAPYAYGLPKVLINWQELSGLLAPGAREIAGAE